LSIIEDTMLTSRITWGETQNVKFWTYTLRRNGSI